MRRRIVKLLKALGLALALLAVILAVFALWLVRRPWTATEGTLAVRGLRAPVEILRDRWGVPHIYAANEHDLFFAQGWAHAQDRLWQMEFNRHVSGGSLAELFGPAVVPADKAMRTYGLRRGAARDLALLSPETRAILAAYAEGVNAYVAANRGRLPLEFTLLGVSPAPWTPVDSIAWARMIGLSLGQNNTQEILRARLAAKVGPAAARQLMAPYPGSGALIVAPPAGGYAPAGAPTSGPHVPALLAAFLGSPVTARGSNNWVVHGSRTASGRPLLANDTHLWLGMPSPWTENGLHGGRFDVVGFSFAGVPMVLIGHNARIAWGISNMCGDSEDLFVERLNDRRQVQVGGAWRDATIVREPLRVRGGPPQIVEVVVTPHGPLINEAEDLRGLPPLALRWTLDEPSQLFDAVAGFDTAGDWSSFRRALSHWGAPTLNFVYADVDGNIGYQGAGLIPVRAPGQDGLFPVAADAPDRDWRGFLPFDALPSLYNPPSGLIVTANNKVVADSYPHLIAYDYADPYRAGRIQQVLAQGAKLTAEDMRALQGDVASPPAAAMRPYLLAAAKPASERERQALALVRGWDLRFNPESAGATIYYAWYTALLSDIYSDELGEDLAKAYRPLSRNETPMWLELMKMPRSSWFDDVRTRDRVETRDDVVHRAFREAVDGLAARLGGDPAAWRWGSVHRGTLAHQPFAQSGIAPLVRLFNGASLPLPGEAFTVDAMSPSLLDPYSVVFGVSQRLIVDLSDLSQSSAINSSGQSGQLFHRHREDQIPLWARNQDRPMPFSRARVEKAAESKLVLQPRP